MLKNLLLTVSLVGAGLGAGYHADTILAPLGERLSGELQALVSVFSYDPRAATLECVRPGVELSTCRAHALAWVERDGREAVMREIMPQMLDVAAASTDDPTAKFMIEGLKKVVETH